MRHDYCKSKREQITPRQKCLPDTEELLLGCNYKDCDIMHKTRMCSNNQEKKNNPRMKKVGTKTIPNQEATCIDYRLGKRKIKFLQYSITEHNTKPLGLAPCPGGVGLHKKDSMFLFCFVWAFLYYCFFFVLILEWFFF